MAIEASAPVTPCVLAPTIPVAVSEPPVAIDFIRRYSDRLPPRHVSSTRLPSKDQEGGGGGEEGGGGGDSRWRHVNGSQRDAYGSSQLRGKNERRTVPYRIPRQFVGQMAPRSSGEGAIGRHEDVPQLCDAQDRESRVSASRRGSDVRPEGQGEVEEPTASEYRASRGDRTGESIHSSGRGVCRVFGSFGRHGEHHASDGPQSRMKSIRLRSADGDPSSAAGDPSLLVQ